jgi:hypothetical protein
VCSFSFLRQVINSDGPSAYLLRDLGTTDCVREAAPVHHVEGNSFFLRTCNVIGTWRHAAIEVSSMWDDCADSEILQLPRTRPDFVLRGSC